MTDIIASILIGVSLVAVWAIIHGGINWFGGKPESYRYAKWNDNYYTLIKEAQPMKVYVLYNQRFCEIRGVYSTHELAMENAEYGTDFVFECILDEVWV